VNNKTFFSVEKRVFFYDGGETFQELKGCGVASVCLTEWSGEGKGGAGNEGREVGRRKRGLFHAQKTTSLQRVRVRDQSFPWLPTCGLNFKRRYFPRSFEKLNGKLKFS
jgi:hypothetical protein